MMKLGRDLRVRSERYNFGSEATGREGTITYGFIMCIMVIRSSPESGVRK